MRPNARPSAANSSKEPNVPPIPEKVRDMLTKDRSPPEPGAVCCDCGRVRGKKARPWHRCDDCAAVLCLRCRPGWAEGRRVCNRCSRADWDARMEAEKVRLAAPTPCPLCDQVVPLGDLKELETAASPVCPRCRELLSKYKTLDADGKRRRNARTGLVEVRFGEHPVPDKDGGRGYAYRSAERLFLGDLVLLPANWSSVFRSEAGRAQVGTVVSTYSDYAGDASSIVRVVKRASQRLLDPPHTTTSPTPTFSQGD